MASDTGTIDLTRVAAERRRLEEEAARAAHDADVEHPAVVAQRIVDEVLRQAQEGGDAADRAPEEENETGSRAIARRIVAEVLADEEAIDRAARAAAEVSARHEAEAAATEIRETVDEEDAPTAAPAEERRIDRVYLVVPNGDSPLVLLPGDTVDPDTRPYVPALHQDLQPQGSDGAALVERALAPLTHGPSPWRQIADAAEPHRGPTQYVAWLALVGMWLVAMAAFLPLVFQSMVQTVDATPPDFWDDSAVIEDGARAGDEGIENPEELLDG